MAPHTRQHEELAGKGSVSLSPRCVHVSEAALSAGSGEVSRAQCVSELCSELGWGGSEASLVLLWQGELLINVDSFSSNSVLPFSSSSCISKMKTRSCSAAFVVLVESVVQAFADLLC